MQVPVPENDLPKPIEPVDKDIKGTKRKFEDISSVGTNQGTSDKGKATADPEEGCTSRKVSLLIGNAKTDCFLCRHPESSKNSLSD